MPPFPHQEPDRESLPSNAAQSVVMSDAGLVLGLHTVPTPSACWPCSRSWPEARSPLYGLLSVVARGPVAASALAGIERAAEHWSRGDKALANLRLIFADLPRCDTLADAARLQAADWVLDQGVTPRVPMRELGLDTAALDAVAGDLAKYNPAQPRVPAGSGAESGRWTDGNFDLSFLASSFRSQRLRFRPFHLVASGPFTPDGYQTTFTTNDALDPKGLNKPPTPEQQEAVAETLNTIVSGNLAAILALEPHVYKNYPHRNTGAVLPPSSHGYVAFDVNAGRAGRGRGRLIVDSSGLTMFFTFSHYESFCAYHIVTRP